MRRGLLIAGAIALALAGCGGDDDDAAEDATTAAETDATDSAAPTDAAATDATEGATESTEGATATEATEAGSGTEAAGEGLRVAVVMPGEINDLSWNQQMYEGMVQLQEDGRIVDFAYTELVPEGDAERTIRGYAEDGYNLVIGHSFGYGETIKVVAADFPDLAFAWAGGIGGQEGNVADYEQPFHQAYYLLGILAGGLTESGVVAGAGGFDIPACHSLIEAFYLGAQEINPDVRGVTAYIGDWIDVQRAKEAATAAAAEGADVFAACGEGPVLGQIEVANEQDLLATGYVGDMQSLGNVVASMVWNIPALIGPMLDDIEAGAFTPAKYYSVGVADEGLLVVINESLADRIPPEALELMETRRQEITDGTFEVPFIPA